VPFDRLTGNAVRAGGVRPVEIVIDPDSGIIVSVEQTDVDLPRNRLIFPGFADIHVHAREFPLPVDADARQRDQWEAACRKETFLSAGRAALNGGITLMAAMPNDPVPPDTPEVYKLKLNLARNALCPTVLFASITSGSEPWDDIPYKVYLDMVPSPVAFCDWKDLEQTLQRYRGCRVFFHAEDPEILNKFRGRGPRWASRPPEAEYFATEKILDLTAKLGLRTHICHVSTERALSSINRYNEQSAETVTCEVTPHHLFFSVHEGIVQSAVSPHVSVAHLLESNPPLRSEADRVFLVDALKDGRVDVLATDHAPHTLDDKKRGAPGMPHLDTLGPFVGWLIQANGFSPERIAEILSAAPGRIFAPDLPFPHGRIEPSWCASFTVLDLDGTAVIDNGEIRGRGPLETRCRWSPFEGVAFPAAVRACIVRGKQYWFHERKGWRP